MPAFFTVKLFFSLSIMYSLEGSQYVHPTFEEWRFIFHLLRGYNLHKLFGILPQRRFVSSFVLIYLITYLYQCRLRDIYFIVWVILSFEILSNITSVAQIAIALAFGSSFSWLLHPFYTFPSL